MAASRQLGFSHRVSLGEHFDVDFGDLLDHLASDPHTRGILLYIESIESPRKFISAARAAARNKPVIVVKAGRAGRGVAGAASHTGALAGADAARAIGYPVALKILLPDIAHQSDVGGVCLNLRGDDEISAAAIDMLARVRSAQPTARIAGLTVQPMARRPHAQELIVGASVDPVFGPVLRFGHGGTAVETIADGATALPPLNRVLARALISRTRVAKLLAGCRDHPPPSSMPLATRSLRSRKCRPICPSSLSSLSST